MTAATRWVVAAALAAVAGSHAAPVHAQFKDNLVQAPRLSAPERGSIQGALSGIGFTAEELARGAFRLPLPIQLPDDRGPLQASVIAAYSPDAGLSEWGMGWTTNLAIRRYRLSGDIDFATDDFISPWGRLRATGDGAFLPSGLASPVRVAQVDGDWVATDSAGTQYRFSAAAGIKTERGSWTWQLTNVTGLLGDQTTLEWSQNASGRPFLSHVRWGGRSAGLQYDLALGYETIPPVFTDHATGAALDRRITTVTISALDAVSGELRERWHYLLAYTGAPFGPAFYLATIQRVFAGGEAQPAMAYHYELDDTRLPAATLDNYSGLDAVIHAFGDSVLQPDHSAIHDVDADGRPDFEVASQLTLVQHTDAGWVQAALPSATNTNAKCRPRASSSNVPRVLARLTADSGEPHVLYTAQRTTGPVTSQVLVCDRLGHTIVDLTVPDDWRLGSNTRLIDIDHDHRPDIVRVAREGVYVLHNESDAQSIRFVAQPLFPWSLGLQPDTSWLDDLDGDGNVDIVVRSPDGLFVQFGLGGQQWTAHPTLFHFVTAKGATLGSVNLYQVTFVDANKDGLADVVLTKDGSAWLYTNRGGSFVEVPVAGLRNVPSSSGVPVVADLNGNGNTEIAFPTRGTTNVVELATPTTGLLANADDNMGTVVRFHYKRSDARAAIEQRITLLDSLGVESSGYDPVSYSYSYGAPVLHSAGKQLVGFISVDKHSPFLTEHVTFHNDDDVAGITSLSESSDERTPGIIEFTRREYDDVVSRGVRWLRPALVESGHHNSDGTVTLSTTTQYSLYERDFCPTVVTTNLPDGQLLATTTLASIASLPDDQHCLAGSQLLTGTHNTSALDFSYQANFSRNDLGQLTRVTQIAPNGAMLVLQDTTYDSDHRVSTIDSPGHGTTTASYDTTGRLIELVDPSGVATVASSLDSVSDAMLALKTDRPGATTTSFFAYDGQERLQAAWDDVSGASAAQPLTSYAYQNASNAVPGRIDTQTLVDAITGHTRHAVELQAADGALMVAGAWLGDHFAMGRASITTRTALSVRSVFVGNMTGDAVATMTSADLRALGAPLTETVHAGFGHEIQDSTTTQDSVVGVTTTEMVLGTGELITRVHEPDGITAESAVDAAGRVVRKTDENGVVHRYSYDALGRLIRVDTPDGGHALAYDGLGRASQVSRDGVGTITYSYDPVSGLPVHKQRLDTTGAVIDTTETTYDANARAIQVTRSSPSLADASSTLYFDYDGQLGGTPALGQLGRLNRIRGDGWERSALFDALGRPTLEHIALTGWRDATRDKTYRADGSIASDTLTIADASGAVKFTSTQEIQLDDLGRTSALAIDGAVLYTLSYDDEGRLARADFTSGEALTFDYDPVTHLRRGHHIDAAATSGGVRWERNERGLVGSESYDIGGTQTRRDYSYDGRGALTLATTGNDAASYSYTASGLPDTISDTAGSREVHRSGSQLTVGDIAYTWDAAGRVVGKGEWTFRYGPDGELDHASRAGRDIDFVYDETGQQLLKRVDGVPVRGDIAGGVLTEDHFVELVVVGGVVAGVLDNGQFTALLTDPRGTPFAGPDGTQGLASPYGVRASHLGLADVIDYARLGWDADLEVIRMGVRNYDPRLSQFLTPDPLYFEDLEKCRASPLQCALYGYAGGNPISFIDATGMGFFSFMWDVGSGAVDGVVDMAVGVGHMVRHPIATGEGLVHMAAHPIASGEMIIGAVSKSVSACASLDGHACGHLATDIASVFVGAEAAKVGELAKLGEAAKVGELAEAAKVGELAEAAKVGEVADAAKAGDAAQAGEKAAALEPYGGPGGGHHVPAKSAFKDAAGYDMKKALAMSNKELARLGLEHADITAAQRIWYKVLERSGAKLTWESVRLVETNALVSAGMKAEEAVATVNKAIEALKASGVTAPTNIPWGK